MGSKDAYPSEQLLDSIEEIATIKQTLSLRDRSLTSANGLYVQSGSLPGGATQYMAGGKFITKLVFIKEPDGSRNIKKYQPGDWETKVDETLDLCRTLKRASEVPQNWTAEKIAAYEAQEAINVDLLNKVAEANRQHYAELNKQWQLRGLPRWIELRNTFLDELKKEWPIEYLELQTNQKGARDIAKLLQENTTKAYGTGYMCGRGWISLEELTNANLYLGDLVAGAVKDSLKGAKSKGIAFATSFARIAAIGTADALKKD